MEQGNLREEDKDTMVSAENYVLIKTTRRKFISGKVHQVAGKRG